jgi:alpha/beta superfamily hydrolase
VSITAGKLTLAGLTYSPREQRTDVCAIISHGFTASKESVDLLAAYLAARGYPALTYDFRGHKLGASSGDLNHAREALDDLWAAASFARDHFRTPACVLIGHSMGALVSLLAALDMRECVGVVAIATGCNPSAGFEQPVGQAMLSQRSSYVSGAEPITLLKQFDELVSTWSGVGDQPALFVAAKGDVVVKPSRVRELADRAGTMAEYAEIEGSHLEAPQRARGVVANWLDAHFKTN